jgi:hypothetical protein
VDDGGELRATAAAALDPPCGERAAYRGYGATLAALVAAASRGAAVHRIGESVEGTPIWSFVVGPDAPRATTLIVGGLHAMEHVGVAAAVTLLERAVGSSSPWRDHRLVVIPLANPDGFRAVCGDLAAGRRRFRRKNARGVDLNRNFAAFWDDRYYLNRLAPRLFASGPAPLSEPEARAIDHALARFRPDHAVSLHAFGRWIFVPYAGTPAPPRDLARLLEVARDLASVQARPYRVMQLGRRSRLFLARGAEIDHMYERHGVLSFLFEIGAGPRLAAPATWVEPYGWYTPPPALLERDLAEVVPAVERLAEHGGRRV